MKDLLKVLDMSEDEQESKLRNYAYNHREEGHWHNYMNGHISLADLAFRLSGGKIAGKTPIEHIINALIKDIEGQSK